MASTGPKTVRDANGATATVDAEEAAHFGALAEEWWDPAGSSAMLHRLNPVRLRYIRREIDRHFDIPKTDLKPLSGRRVLDIGCGAGLIAEPLARMGGAVTAIDAAPENIAAARDHAAARGLSIDYRACGVEDLGEGPFDLIVSLEVVEHVSDPAAFVGHIARLLGEGGLAILSTPNRTAASRLLMVELAERTGRIPRGTHDWDKFLTPEELEALLREAGLEPVDCTGIFFDPVRGLHLSPNKSLNYLVAATKA